MKEKYNNLFMAALVFIFIGAISFSVLYNVFTKSTTISLNAIGLAINCCIVFRWTYNTILVEKKKPQHDNIRELTDYRDELAKEQSENWLLLKIYLLNTLAFVTATKGGFNIVTIICLVSSIGLGVFFAQKKPMEEWDKKKRDFYSFQFKTPAGNFSAGSFSYKSYNQFQINANIYQL